VAGRALVIGGNGQVGRGVAAELAGAGWAVAIVRKGSGPAAADIEAISADRNDDAAMDAMLGRGFDVVIDLVAFNASHAAQLVRHRADIGSAVMLSSAAVYVDDEGRSLQSVADRASAPRFDGPVPETAETVPPGHDSYAGRKGAAEATLLDSAIPTTVIRPTAIHGANSPQPREWFYVRRALDGRGKVVLGFGGRSSLHPVSAGNLARMIRLAAERPGNRVLNAGDPGMPDEAEIATSLGAALGWDFEIVRLPDAAPIASPWSLPSPFFLSLDAARTALGYEPAETYRQAAPAMANWLVAEHRAGTLASRLSPRFGPAELGCQVFIGGGAAPFDYAAEDRALAA
jgi:nucleoside-diphosphate-sugar epimerase